MYTGRKECRVYSFLPVLLGKVGVKIVSGYTKVNAQVILAGKSVGVYSFLPVCIKVQENFTVGAHSLLPVTNRCRGTLYPSSISKGTLFLAWKECRAQYTLSSISKMLAHFSVGVHFFLPVNVQGEKNIGVLYPSSDNKVETF